MDLDNSCYKLWKNEKLQKENRHAYEKVLVELRSALKGYDFDKN